MNNQMSEKIHHQISVGIRLEAIGNLKIHGRAHQVTPIEVSTDKILFLCSWDIPVTSNVTLCYELDDSYDRFIVSNCTLTREIIKESMLYTARFQVTEDVKLRITGMLNRMLLHHFSDPPIRSYTNTGTFGRNPHLNNSIIQ